MKYVKEEHKGVSIELRTSIGVQRIEFDKITEEQIELLHSYGIDIDEFFVEIPQKQTVVHYEAVVKPKTKTKKK